MVRASRQALDAFGETVVREVYNTSFQYLFDVMSRGMKGNRPDPLHIPYQSLDPATHKVVRQFVMEEVDQTFAQFLAFIDNHQISIPLPSQHGEIQDVTSLSDGLAAEPYNE